MPLCEISEWNSNWCKVWHEPAVVPHQSKERSDILLSNGGVVVLNSNDFVFVWSELPLANNMSQIVHLVTSKLTLRQFHSEIGISKTLKHSPKVLKMLLPGVTINVYVIDVGSHIGLATSQDVIHKALERGWSIVESKGHHLKLVRPNGVTNAVLSFEELPQAPWASVVGPLLLLLLTRVLVRH